MPTVPWTVAAHPAAGPEVVFLASRLHLRTARDIPGFLRSAMKIRDRLIEPQFASWTATAPNLPKARSNAKELWAEGRRRLAIR